MDDKPRLRENRTAICCDGLTTCGVISEWEPEDNLNVEMEIQLSQVNLEDLEEFNRGVGQSEGIALLLQDTRKPTNGQKSRRYSAQKSRRYSAQFHDTPENLTNIVYHTHSLINVENKDDRHLKRNKSTLCLTELDIKYRKRSAEELQPQESLKKKKMSKMEIPQLHAEFTRKTQKKKKQFQRLTLPCKKEYVKAVSQETEDHSIFDKASSLITSFVVDTEHSISKQSLMKEEVLEIIREMKRVFMEILKTMLQEQKKAEEYEIHDDGRISNTLRSDATSCELNSSYAIAYDVEESKIEDTIEHLKGEISQKDKQILDLKIALNQRCNDFSHFKDETETFQSMNYMIESFTMKIENVYMSKKDKNKALEKNVFLQKSEEMENKGFKIRQALSNLFRRLSLHRMTQRSQLSILPKD